MASKKGSTTRKRGSVSPATLASDVQKWACAELNLEGAAVQHVKGWLATVAVATPSPRDDRLEAKEVIGGLADALARLQAAGRNPYIRTLAEQLCPELPRLQALRRGLSQVSGKGRGKHALEPRTALVAAVSNPMPDGAGGKRRQNYRTLDEVVALSILAGLLTRADLVTVVNDPDPLRAAIALERKRVRQAEDRLMQVWRGTASKVRIIETRNSTD